MELLADDGITKVNAEEIDKYFTRFSSGHSLSTSIVNPLISSFHWGADSLVLHSSKIDIDRSELLSPWTIPPSCKHIVLPSCYNNHWTLFYIDLKDRVVTHYNSYQAIALPDALRGALTKGLSDFYPRSIRLHFETPVSLHLYVKNQFSFVEDTIQQKNGTDCGLYTIRNAEILSRREPHGHHKEHSSCLRKLYLKQLIDLATWSKQDLRLQRQVYGEPRQHTKRLRLPSFPTFPGRRRNRGVLIPGPLHPEQGRMQSAGPMHEKVLRPLFAVL